MIDVITTWLTAATVDQSPAVFFAGILLALLSVTGVLLSTSLKASIRIVGFCCGLLSQPIWFYIAIDTHNLGLFINSVFFTLLWAYRFAPAIRRSPSTQAPQ